MRRRIRDAFVRASRKGRAAFVPFLTAGDPSLERTPALVAALERAGADIVELGVPFSDPIADGPVIQRASERALAAGATLGTVLQVVREIRFRSEIPLVLFSYFNPIHRYGLARFAVDAAAAGVDAVLVTDAPVEEARPLWETLSSVGVDLIPLVAPTSTRRRIKAVKALAGAFVYFVARTGVTGMREVLEGGLGEQVRLVRRLAGTRVVVGFGISNPEQVHAVARLADGVVVGSALVARIAELGNTPELEGEIEGFARSLAAATVRR
ncbi:MAG: tryptophan synthase subunit alpha [Thermoanaerobaculaceae bacterium]|nr:tryptophan synthase subunit alpha [Thermoanaerobaculaceae bacterium]